MAVVAVVCMQGGATESSGQSPSSRSSPTPTSLRFNVWSEIVHSTLPPAIASSGASTEKGAVASSTEVSPVEKAVSKEEFVKETPVKKAIGINRQSATSDTLDSPQSNGSPMQAGSGRGVEMSISNVTLVHSATKLPHSQSDHKPLTVTQYGEKSLDINWCGAEVSFRSCNLPESPVSLYYLWLCGLLSHSPIRQ